MASKSKALAVHGYKLSRAPSGALCADGHALRVCEAVAQVHTLYARVVLLGGGPTYEWNAIDDAMHVELQRLGVPKEKLFVRTGIVGLDSRQPLDTVEEAKLLKALQDLWPEFDFDSIAIKAWTPRIRNIYAALKIECGTLREVNAHVPLLQAAAEGILRTLSSIDPLGEGKLTGAPHRLIRALRA